MNTIQATHLRSRIAEIQKLCNPNDIQIDDQFNHSALHLQIQNTVEQIVSDFPALEIQDANLHHLKDELKKLHLENHHVTNQIQLLAKSHNDDSILLEAKLEEMECSLDYITSKDQNKAEATQGIDSPMLADDGLNLTIANLDENLEQFKLENKIDEMKLIVKSLENLQFTVKWFEVAEQIEDAFTGLKVLAFDENCIRLSLQTYMPTFEGISYLLRVKNNIDAYELNHELLIEVFDGTMKLKNVQILTKKLRFNDAKNNDFQISCRPGDTWTGFIDIDNSLVFPNDIYVNDIVDATNSVSKSSLQWFIQKVQDRIILSTLRHLVVKDANKSRYSLEYLDKDETIVAHMAGGIDAYIKLSHGWPVFDSPLKLICIKGSDDLKRTSLSFHCKVEKLANSLDTHIRQNISSFVDAVEKVLIEQLQLDLRAGDRVSDI